MGINKSKGNMYEFITHTWNTIKGECPHKCSYCYMKKWGKQPALKFDEKEFKKFDKDIAKIDYKPFIFVGSSCDMFSRDIPTKWIAQTLDFLKNSYNAKYLFQTKNPGAVNDNYLPNCSVVATTIETNRHYKDIMGNSPAPFQRAIGMYCIDLPKYITIEPIMDFDLDSFVELIESVKPEQVNIGADSQNSNLPEPSADKIQTLISELEKYTRVNKKKNLKRILK